MNNKTTILIPALNEEITIGKAVDESLKQGWTVMVCDNGSTDRTREVSMSSGVVPILVLEKGKGNAVRGLISHIDTSQTIMIDADCTYPTEEARRVLDVLESYECDVVIGYREHRERGSMPLINLIGNRLLSLLASILYRHTVLDVCSGLWAFRTSTLKKFNLTSEGFTLEAELFINTVRHGCSLRQIPISYKARPDGSKPKLHTSAGLKIGWFLIKRRFTQK